MLEEFYYIYFVYVCIWVHVGHSLHVEVSEQFLLLCGLYPLSHLLTLFLRQGVVYSVLVLNSLYS